MPVDCLDNLTDSKLFAYTTKDSAVHYYVETLSEVDELLKPGCSCHHCHCLSAMAHGALIFNLMRLIR